ncbi:MAG TPA: hypothetical protein VKU02_10245 [Gemmataceae bacterium]|nr:hypothetical protein [Gemmataceae bacterium]
MTIPVVPAGNPPPSPAVVIGPPIRPPRHPLGLPAGSVRALLTFMVLGLIWALLLLPEEKNIQIPIYLYYLMFLILGHFFAAHGHSISGPATGPAPPLYLPRGTLRTLIVAGFLGILAYRYYLHQNLQDLFNVREPLLQQPYLPLVILAGFFVGVMVSRLSARRFRMAPWYQDILAWVALLATLGLSAEVIIQLIINPSVEPEHRLYPYQWHLVLCGIVSFYFGARS